MIHGFNALCDRAIYPLLAVASSSSLFGQSLAIDPPAQGCVRVATFNVAMNRKEAGQLIQNLKDGDEQASRIACIIRLVQPDVLLVNELDYSDGQAAKLFLEKYLAGDNRSKIPTKPCRFEYQFSSSVNTGMPSGLDLNLNGRSNDNDDAWGYGAFPGQYGMAVYSRYPIREDQIRTFQKLKWSAMPGAKRPKIIDAGTNIEKYFHSDDVWNQLRLSSKSHWDVPILVGESLLHVIASHPTPPVFDGPEDRNGCRNHDEIRLLKDYVEGTTQGNYIVDDSGVVGPLARNAHFVIMGDLNSDPNDGSGILSGIRDLLGSERVASGFVPESEGGRIASRVQGKMNDKHRGNPAHDTGDFNDASVGNLRIDFVLPSSNCHVVRGGVFWPSPQHLQDLDPDLAEASDHHLVWLDIRLTKE